jgi:rubrerythrin
LGDIEGGSMATIFSGSEIVRMGIQIEENGKAFYETLANQTKTDKAQELYRFLSAEEQKHIVVFQNILDKLDNSEPAEAYPGEYLEYMKVLADEYVFTQKDKGKHLAKQIKTDKDAVELGIKFEKDSILFYEGMKKSIPQTHHKVVNELILQETSHFRQLADLKRSL